MGASRAEVPDSSAPQSRSASSKVEGMQVNARGLAKAGS
jgi:hypothetical protein